MTARRRRKAAFTLIELMLVTLLLLTLVGLSIPLFKKTLSGISAKNAAFNISKLINYAQEMAVLERKTYKVAFDLKNGRYQLFEADAAAKPPVSKRAQGRFGRAFSVPKGISLNADKKEIFFYPDGHCDAFKLEVLAKGEGYSLNVKRFGNMVEVKETTLER